MIRVSFSLTFALVSCFCAAAATQQQVAFERGTAIWIANIDGSDAKKVAEGSAPDLSRDGTRIAFHTDESTKKDLVRHIAVVEVATKRVTVFKKEIPSQNCQRPIWSPDGTRILFEIWSDGDWHLAMINMGGSGFRYVKKATPRNNSFWSACFAPDGKSIYVQDLTNLYQLELDGTERKKWDLHSLFPTGAFNSGSRFAVSPDGKALLMSVDMDEDIQRKDWDGPPPALWTLDLATEKPTRITPKGMLAWDGCWLGKDEILFVSQAAKEKEPSIYRMSLQGKPRKVILKNARTPSISR